MLKHMCARQEETDPYRSVIIISQGKGKSLLIPYLAKISLFLVFGFGAGAKIEVGQAEVERKREESK